MGLLSKKNLDKVNAKTRGKYAAKKFAADSGQPAGSDQADSAS